MDDKDKVKEQFSLECALERYEALVRQLIQHSGRIERQFFELVPPQEREVQQRRWLH
ncbi:MAG: hypothetical protein HQL56_08950 [Magnetococcales bacterium]|nr:hypothetical protein [Magnetococcales bacterium]